MITVKELIEKINKSDEVRTASYAEDELFGEDWDKIHYVATVDLEEHRWYVVGTAVYQMGDEFFGIRGPVSLKSENMDYDDILYQCKAFEMQQVTLITYTKKKD